MSRAVVNAVALLIGIAGMIVASLPVQDGWRTAGLAGMGICMIIEVGLAVRGLHLSMKERRGKGPTL